MNFLRHYDGAMPGVKRKQPSTAAAKQAYEKKRVRTFQEAWLKANNWLKYDSDRKLMFCTPCTNNAAILCCCAPLE